MISYFFQGDAPFYFDQQLSQLGFFPKIFNSFHMGMNVGFRLWYDYPIQVIVFLFHTLGLSWILIEKILWGGAIFGGFYSIYTFLRKYLNPKASFVGSVLYLFNTYSILLFSGGQLGVFASYVFAPYVLHRYFHTLEGKAKGIRSIYLNGLSFAFLVMCDLRIALIVCATIFLYFLYRLFLYPESGKSLGKMAINNSLITGVITFLIHSYWIVPMILFPSTFDNLGNSYTSSGMVRFLSVADFSHSLSLLHPNWPENLFGKVYFMRPEFIIFPIFSSLALIFITKAKKNELLRTIPFYFILLLGSSFLSKGTNEPFGFIYIWLFEHVPGFVMFRDPTKFYLITALSYSILIPYVLLELSSFFKRNISSKYTGLIARLPSVFFLVFFFISIRLLFTGQVKGNVQPKTIPNEYFQFARILANDSVFSRVLWIPSADKTVYTSSLHPTVTYENIFGSASFSAQLSKINQTDFLEKIRNSGIGYIGVPYDIEQKIFLQDNRFNSVMKNTYVNAVDRLGLEKINDFQEISLWKVSFYSSLLGLVSQNNEKPLDYSLSQINLGHIFAVVPDGSGENIILRYSYDPYWRLYDGKNEIQPFKTNEGFMEFPVLLSSRRTIDIVYTPQKWSTYGLVAGWGLFGLSLIAVLLFSKNANT